MAKQPLGKTLLRNVIRHTDAHNKIQEEMEMWKMDAGGSGERASEHDDRDARYWTQNCMNSKLKTLNGDIAASRSFIQRSLTGMKETVPKRRTGATKKSLSLSQKQACPNDPKNPHARRKRKRRKTRRENVRKQSARAAAMTAVTRKKNCQRRGLKVDIKTRKPAKKEAKTRTAARETVMTNMKVGLTKAKNANVSHTKTPTQGFTQKRRGKTGKQQVRSARAIVLQT
uniref:NKAP domain containing 1 n=1 Tax=Labrus bergylta TaxID=56723 RepID=A0A3Q3N5R4_9LABR